MTLVVDEKCSFIGWAEKIKERFSQDFCRSRSSFKLGEGWGGGWKCDRLWLKKFSDFSIQLDFYFSLTPINYHNLKEREIKINWSEKCETKTKLNDNKYKQ